jgi:uncharacterized membrane protein (DUF106 family)
MSTPNYSFVPPVLTVFVILIVIGIIATIVNWWFPYG